MRRKLFFVLPVIALSTILLGGCSDSNDIPPSSGGNFSDPKALFWEVFQQGKYEQLPGVIERLSGAFMEDPKDFEVALLLAHSYFWRAGESARMENPPPNIFDEFIIAKYYFDKAYQLNGDDHRIAGWSASVDVSLGFFHRDPAFVDRGYQNLLTSISLYPEFNHFSAGFPLATVPPSDSFFAVGIEHMWSGVDACLDQAIDRNNPDYAAYMFLETNVGEKRVCWNNEKIPHGLEGFFLAFGDMLVKNGQPDVAKIMYENAKYSTVYEQWDYQDVLEERIASADARAVAYQSPDPDDHPPTLINEPYACVACHGK